MISHEPRPPLNDPNEKPQESSAIENLQILLEDQNPVDTEQSIDPLLDRIIKDLQSLRQIFIQDNDIERYIRKLGEQDQLLRELYQGEIPPEDPSGISSFRANLNNVEQAKKIHEGIRKAILELSEIIN